MLLSASQFSSKVLLEPDTLQEADPLYLNMSLLPLLAHLYTAQTIDSCSDFKQAWPCKVASMQGRCQHI